MNPVIRRATAADVEVLAEFNAGIAREAEGLELDRATVTRGVARFLERPGQGFYLVAETGGRVVGSLMITHEWSDWRDGVFWWIQSVYVRAEHRRQGIYRGLYEHVRALAEADRDVCGLRLYVERSNAVARRTYATLGMRETSYRICETALRRAPAQQPINIS